MVLPRGRRGPLERPRGVSRPERPASAAALQPRNIPMAHFGLASGFGWASEPRGPRGQHCRILVREGSELVATLALAEKSVYIFGRNPDCDVQLQHPTSSRKHAALVHTGNEDKIYLVDLGSTQGTFVGDASSRIVRASCARLTAVHCEGRFSHAGAKYAHRAVGGGYLLVRGCN